MMEPISELKNETLTIEPAKGWVPLRLDELWYYRELAFFLTWRDISVRYKQTLLGVMWAIIQPFFTMVVFSIFFGQLAKMPSDGIPYPIFSFCALLPWQLFANALSQSSNSLVANKNLITKVYFPRLLVPASAVLSGLADFVIAFGMLIAMMIFYGVKPTWGVVALPLFLLLVIVTALGVGLWLSALNVKYRDVQYVIPFLTQFWMFCTPIAYPTSLVPEFWRPFYGLNPMVGVVEGFRWALLGSGEPPTVIMLVSAVVAFGILFSGAYYFRNMERVFADVA